MITERHSVDPSINNYVYCRSQTHETGRRVASSTRSSGAKVRLLGHYLRQLGRRPAAAAAVVAAGESMVAPVTTPTTAHHHQRNRLHHRRHLLQQQQQQQQQHGSQRANNVFTSRRYGADDVISTEFCEFVTCRYKL